MLDRWAGGSERAPPPLCVTTRARNDDTVQCSTVQPQSQQAQAQAQAGRICARAHAQAGDGGGNRAYDEMWVNSCAL
jgi:hypothetical protein